MLAKILSAPGSVPVSLINYVAPDFISKIPGKELVCRHAGIYRHIWTGYWATILVRVTVALTLQPWSIENGLFLGQGAVDGVFYSTSSRCSRGPTTTASSGAASSSMRRLSWRG